MRDEQQLLNELMEVWPVGAIVSVIALGVPKIRKGLLKRKIAEMQAELGRISK